MKININFNTCIIGLITLGLVVVATNKEIAVFKDSARIGTCAVSGYGPTCLALLDEGEIAVGGDDNKTHIYLLSPDGKN